MLYAEIQQAKASNIEFENISVFKEVAVEKGISDEFINFAEVVFFEVNLSEIKDIDQYRAINITISPNNDMILEMIEVPDVYYDYEVVTSDGRKFPANKNIKHYRGIVKGDTSSLVAITFYKDEVIGSIMSSDGNFNIVKDKQSGKHIF